MRAASRQRAYITFRFDNLIQNDSHGEHATWLKSMNTAILFGHNLLSVPTVEDIVISI